MKISTKRFGDVEVADNKILTFPNGLLGFSELRTFAVLESGPDTAFFWLQSVEKPETAFVITDPDLFFKPGQPRDMHEDQVFVIVNKHDQTLTANMAGPLIINTRTRIGEQRVLEGEDTRRPLLILEPARNRSDRK